MVRFGRKRITSAPIGIIANCLGVVVGGILGSLIGPWLTESFKANLNLVLGACSMTMGISSIALWRLFCGRGLRGIFCIITTSAVLPGHGGIRWGRHRHIF